MSLEHPGQLPRTKVGKEGHAESCQVLLSTPSACTQAPPGPGRPPEACAQDEEENTAEGPRGTSAPPSAHSQTLCTFQKALTEGFVLG